MEEDWKFLWNRCSGMRDTYHREIDYMRISLTNRCNFRCKYCMPEVKKTKDPLELDEIYEAALAAVDCGITKFKITGGEPLIRKGTADFIKKLCEIEKVRDVTMTTNGFYLKENAWGLKAAGLSSVNISLDTLKSERFKDIVGIDALSNVLDGIKAAVDAKLKTKINTVIQRGVNEDEIFNIVELAKDLNVDIRFIEMMPIGHGKSYAGVSNEEIMSRIKAKYGSYEKVQGRRGNGPAEYIKLPGFTAAIGFIGAVHNKFCESCNRIRLTSTGKLKPCLCYDSNIDISNILKDEVLIINEKREKLRESIMECIISKPCSHSFEDLSKVSELKDMVEIGG